MTEEKTPTEEAVSHAVEAAKVLVTETAKATAEEVKQNDKHTTKALVEALRQVFGDQEEAQRFIDTKRIPLICKDISNINKSMDELHKKLDEKFITTEAFWPIKTIVYGGAGMILVAVFSAMVYLVLK